MTTDPNEVDWLIPDEYVCKTCGFPIDSPNHNLGCEEGKKKENDN